MYWRKKENNNVFYCSEVIGLDIETAWNHDIVDPITWMVSARVVFDGESLLFRKPTELMAWYNSLVEKYNLNFLKRITTIIHNASYDLSYLLPYIKAYLPNERPYGLFDSPNKIIMYRQGCFEFRCTFRLTNETLAKWSNEMAVEHPKKVGMYNYNKILFQDSKLSKKEIEYGEWDVFSMKEAFEKQLKLFHDDVTTVPLTSTGYIRRILRKASRKDKYYRGKYFTDTQLNLEQYNMCLNSFSGGYVHCNRFVKAQLLDQKYFEKFGCTHGALRDFRSQYPKHLMQGLLPIGKPIIYYDIKNPIQRAININIDKILDLYPEFSSITKMRVYALELKDEDKTTMPIFQTAKMYNKTDDIYYHEDNGRLLKMYKGHFETYVDNHTLKIIKEQYNGKIVIEKVLIFKNGYLPECLQAPIDSLFLEKTEYKDKYFEKQEKFGEFANKTIAAKQDLDAIKKLLNGCFGCFAMKPIRVNYAVNTTGKMSDDMKQATLEEYYAKYNNFLAYQLGIFVPALARAELFEYIDLIGQEKILYTDTDSLYYITNDEIEKKIEVLNKVKEEHSKYVIDSKGNKVLYEAFEKQAEFKAFKGLHSKCYGYVSTDGVLKITISGVPERTIIGMKKEDPIYMTREEELAGCTKTEILRNRKKERDPVKALDNLDYKFKFKINTGVRVMYIQHDIGIEEVDGHKVETAGGAVIIPLDEKIIKDEDKLDGFDYIMEYNALDGVTDVQDM